MNLKCIKIITVLMLLTVTAKAQSTGEESRFLKIINDALNKQDVAVLMTNICWDNAPDAQRGNKAWVANFFNIESTNNYASAIYVDEYEVPKTFTSWVYNLSATKWIKVNWVYINPRIRNGPRLSRAPADRSMESFWKQYLPVGEKDGKLMIAMRFKR